MSWIWVVIIAILLVVCPIAYSYKKKLLDSGQITKRSADFEKYAEIFTIRDIPFSNVLEALRSANYYGKVTLAFSSEKETIVFKGAGWGAQLYHMREDTSRTAYCFEFTNWKTTNSWGVPDEQIAMNTVLTTVEKTILQLDPNTQVSTKKVEIKTKHKFF